MSSRKQVKSQKSSASLKAGKKKLPEIIEVEMKKARNKRGSLVYVQSEVVEPKENPTTNNNTPGPSSTQIPCISNSPSKRMRNDSVGADYGQDNMEDATAYRSKKPKRSTKVTYFYILLSCSIELSLYFSHKMTTFANSYLLGRNT
jgi:hypothetical protein